MKSEKLNDRLIAERISTLLSHYWTAEDHPAVRKAQITDWLEDLAEFPAAIVSTAASEWRQENTRKPTPADIRLRCIAEQRRRAPARAKPAEIGDMANEAIPAADVVREHWKQIRYRLLTAAEKELFLAERKALGESLAKPRRMP